MLNPNGYDKSRFRRPVKFPMYYFLLVRSHGIYCLDCGSWDQSVIEHARREERRLNPQNQTIVCTSPTDDESVINTIVRKYNHGRQV